MLFPPKRPEGAQEQAPPAYGQYGALRDEVPEEDMEADRHRVDDDPIKDFGVTPTRRGQTEATSESHQERKEA